MTTSQVELSPATMTIDRLHNNLHRAAELSIMELGMAWFPEQPGGLDRYYFELLAALSSHDAQISGFVTGTSLVGANSNGVVQAFGRSDASVLSRWRALKRIVKQQLSLSPSSIIATHFALYAFPILRLIKCCPHVVHFHGPWAAESREEGSGYFATAAKRWLEQQVYRRADRCIVLSAAFAKILADTYGVEKNRIRVIPGGVNIERFSTSMSMAEARCELGWAADRPIVLCVRRLARRMGLDHLIAAVAILKTKIPDVLVLIAGRGALHAELSQQILAGGLQNNIKLLGFAPDHQLPMMYQAANISIVPSQSLEGFGLTTVESLSAGTPVLVTPVGGLPEVVRHLSPRLILQDCTKEAIAAGLLAALSGEMSLPSSDECRQFAQDRYDWKKIAARVLDVYCEAQEFHAGK